MSMFSKCMPIIATALVSVVGAAVMFFIKQWSGLACLTAMVMRADRAASLPGAVESENLAA